MLSNSAVSPSHAPANLFDLMRLVAALMVIVGHTWPLTGTAGVPTFAGIRLHHLGVYIFFVISGYLLATSWERSPEAAPFLMRRCLRIFPALTVTVLLTVLVIGPLNTSHPLPEYWTSGQTWQYLWNITLIAQYPLPGVFENNPEPVVNGSLWSLGVEFCCYLGLVATARLGRLPSVILRTTLAAGTATVILTGAATGSLRTTAIAVVFFLLGSLAARGRTLRRWPLWPAIPGLAAAGMTDGNSGLLLAWLGITYAVIAGGSRTSASATAARRAGDPSYGMYLWGFPIQQLLVAAAPTLPLMPNIIIVAACSTTAGYLSWHLVERPFKEIGTTRPRRP